LAQIADQIATLVDYVRQEFSGHDGWDSRAHDRSAHTVSVATDGGVLLLTASFEILSDNTPAEVASLLREWNVADALRNASPTTRLLVTRDGWRVRAGSGRPSAIKKLMCRRLGSSSSWN